MTALFVFVVGYLAVMAETQWFRDFYTQREERQVLALGLIGLCATLLLGGAFAVGVLARQMQEMKEKELVGAVQTQAANFRQVLSSTLQSLNARWSDDLTSRMDLPAMLRDLAGPDGSAWVEGSNVHSKLRVGPSPGVSQFRFRIENAGAAWLTWNRTWVLEVHFSAAQRQETVVIQTPLPALEGVFSTSEADKASGMETLLCGRAGGEEMACFYSALTPKVLLAAMRYKGQPVPMWYALGGQRGVVVAPDYRGVTVVAAHAPLAEFGLGIVRKMEAELMYAPLRNAVWRAIAFMVGIGLFAVALIYLRVRRVMLRVVETGRQLHGVLEVLPMGVWVADASGRFVQSNPAGLRIWGGDRRVGIDQYGESKGWWHDTGKRIKKGDWAVVRAIERGETVLDETIEIECLDGSRKIVSNSAIPLRDEQDAIIGAVVVKVDITAQMQADAQIRRLEHEFHSLADNLPDMVSRFDRELRRIYVNPAITHVTGKPPSFFLGKRIAELDMPESMVSIWTNTLRRVFLTGEPEMFEFKFTGPSASLRFYQARAVPEFGASGEVVTVLVLARDISALKGAEMVLRESEERFHGMTSNVPGMVFQCYRRDGEDQLRFIFVSDGANDLLGIEATAIQLDENAFIGRIVGEHSASFHDSMACSQKNLSLWNWEGCMLGTDGNIKWINLRATSRRQGEDLWVWDGVAINVTESKINEAELLRSQGMLRELSAHLEDVREEERKRIAREIHDELGQVLTALRMDVSLARMNFGESNPPLMKRLQSMTEMVDRTIKIARHVTSSLRPAALDLGIIAALEWLVEEFIGHAGISCELVLEDSHISLNEPMATAVFRIVQESLTNIARHAAATQVEIMVAHTNGRLCIEISDNGIGFDSQATTHKSFGLVGMRERIAILQGEFILDSKPGHGTRIRVCLPVS